MSAALHDAPLACTACEERYFGMILKAGGRTRCRCPTSIGTEQDHERGMCIAFHGPAYATSNSPKSGWVFHSSPFQAFLNGGAERIGRGVSIWCLHTRLVRRGLSRGRRGVASSRGSREVGAAAVDRGAGDHVRLEQAGALGC